MCYITANVLPFRKQQESAWMWRAPMGLSRLVDIWFLWLNVTLEALTQIFVCTRDNRCWLAPSSYSSGVNDMPPSLDTSKLLFVYLAFFWTWLPSVCMLRISTLLSTRLVSDSSAGSLTQQKRLWMWSCLSRVYHHTLWEETASCEAIFSL